MQRSCPTRHFSSLAETDLRRTKRVKDATAKAIVLRNSLSRRASLIYRTGCLDSSTIRLVLPEQDLGPSLTVNKHPFDAASFVCSVLSIVCYQGFWMSARRLAEYETEWLVSYHLFQVGSFCNSLLAQGRSPLDWRG
jgi:hypothetical protein